jgi:glycerol-3-phosphate dehydrogenase (NAD(P)+)
MTSQSLRIGVLGAGSWGTALAHLLASRGHAVDLWAHEPEVVSGINRDHRNPIYLTDVQLPDGITATGDLQQAVTAAEMVLSVVPAQFVRGYVRRVRDDLPAGIPLVVCSKGIERKTLATMEQVFSAELAEHSQRGLCVLSGPSFADEVSRGMPTNVTAASRDLEVARRVQAAVSTRNFRVYTSEDVTGVGIGGALKNIIAIVVGVSDGLGLGYNTRAALITRGLAEITRLAVAMGAKPETLLGLAGVGDLVLTCTSDLSRNRQVGKLLAEGRTWDDIQKQMNTVAEGVPTTESAHHLARERNIDMPITEQLHGVLYRGNTVLDAMRALQDRALKEEWQQP